jgi:hypothetical protein
MSGGLAFFILVVVFPTIIGLAIAWGWNGSRRK